MAKSQNGWSVVTALGIVNRLIPGTKTKISVRKGSAGWLLIHFLAWFNANIERIDSVDGKRDDWGWVVRFIKTLAGKIKSKIFSNHSSATAVDVNSRKHPQGKRGTFTKEQQAKIDHVLRTTYKGLIRHGAHFSTPDDMHFEITPGVTEAQCRALQVFIEKPPPSKRPLAGGIPYPITGVTYTNASRKVMVPYTSRIDNARAVVYQNRPVLVRNNTDQTSQGWVRYWQELIGWTEAAKRWRPAGAGMGYMSAECINYASQLPHLKKVFTTDLKVGPKTWAASEKGAK